MPFNRGRFSPRSRFGSGGGRRFGGMARKPKAFDPSHLVGAATTPNVVRPVFTPVNTFASFSLHQQLERNISNRNYTQLTSIQDQVIPHILAGKDVVGIANTGTGKTAAFLIPLIQRLLVDSAQKVLIVTPTRELAVQIEHEFFQFASGLRLYSALCIGGMPVYRQASLLRRGPQFVIGTPGRLKDLAERGVLSFKTFKTIVLDEVDQMLDMGFIHDVREIISALPQPRHSLFFSATLSPKAQAVSREFLTNPVMVTVTNRETAAQITQSVVRVGGRGKVEVLHDLLKQEAFRKVLVFVRTKHATDRVARSLSDLGIRVAAIHGNKNQSQRRQALESFKSQRVQVLLATDVASRGLDIADVTHVINFDLPGTYEDYIHRIGRTGRADKQGMAVTLVD